MWEKAAQEQYTTKTRQAGLVCCELQYRDQCLDVNIKLNLIQTIVVPSTNFVVGMWGSPLWRPDRKGKKISMRSEFENEGLKLILFYREIHSFAP